jgi:hypothetical protein
MTIFKILLLLTVYYITAVAGLNQDVCLFCGEGKTMTNPDAKLSETLLGQIGIGSRISCGQLESLGKFRFIPPRMCLLIQRLKKLQSICGCEESADSPTAPASSPVAPAPTPVQQMGMDMDMGMRRGRRLNRNVDI